MKKGDMHRNKFLSRSLGSFPDVAQASQACSIKEPPFFSFFILTFYFPRVPVRIFSIARTRQAGKSPFPRPIFPENGPARLSFLGNDE